MTTGSHASLRASWITPRSSCSIGASSGHRVVSVPNRGKLGRTVMERICHIDDVLPGTSKGFRYSQFGKDDIFLVNKSGEIFGYRNSCPHWPGSTLPVKKGQYLDGESRYIVCHGHGALFKIETGVCIRGPCLGGKLIALPIEIDKEGNIFVVNA
ncbi:Rieske 2Fe-2S domain-containing protein [Pseudomonas sp. NBRC 100443]|uniref:Rieske (2Fe-2S) protein n=1 Tax=Pseudomonas sp. NBRC 100443 TaxID=1113665 RepID=UPI00332D21D1